MEESTDDRDGGKIEGFDQNLVIHNPHRANHLIEGPIIIE